MQKDIFPLKQVLGFLLLFLFLFFVIYGIFNYDKISHNQSNVHEAVRGHFQSGR